MTDGSGDGNGVPGQSETSDAVGPPVTSQKTSSAKWIILGVSVVVLVALAGGALWFVLGKRQPSYGPIGTVVIPPTFDLVAKFGDNGLAPATQGDRYGFIDTAGTFVISPQFDDARFFSEGLASVAIGDQWGYVDESGKIVITPQFEETYGYSAFAEGHAVIRVGERYGYIDKGGEQVITPRYDYATSFSEGLAAVEADDEWGYINTDGEEVIALQFDYASAFTEGLGLVKVGERYGYIDTSGAFTINPQFEDAGSFSEGLALAQEGDLFGYIDSSGAWAIAPTFEDAQSFSEGLAAVMNDQKWGFIDSSGEFVISQDLDVKYDVIGDRNYYDIGNFSEGVVVVGERSSGLMGLMNAEGSWVLPPTYKSLGYCAEGLSIFGNNLNSDGYSEGPYGFLSCR